MTSDPQISNLPPAQDTSLGRSEGSPRTIAQRRSLGEQTRQQRPLSSLAQLSPAQGRSNPVDLLESQSRSRIADLIPIRYGRMSDTPFTFLRGAALPMAEDLSRAPSSGLNTWLCGDAHLSNFGLYSTPERELAFDVNDFDETYPGPFEWDVKRLAASLVVASLQNGFTPKQAKKAAKNAAKMYRKTMAEQAELGNLAVWYSGVNPKEVLSVIGKDLDTSTAKKTKKGLRKAKHRDNLQAWNKLTHEVEGQRVFISQPPLIVPIRELYPARERIAGFQNAIRGIQEYRHTLSSANQFLFDSFELQDLARKVVGVGSVGTDAWIALLTGSDASDPLLLQIKEAQNSVLQNYLPGPRYAHHGQRVVQGQTLMQRSSDIFLGWQGTIGIDGRSREYYVRQLRDGKGSVVIEALTPDEMVLYARLCARALAYAHARSGDRIAISTYLGNDKQFDQAIAQFAVDYAERNKEDHQTFLEAIKSGRIQAETGI